MIQEVKAVECSTGNVLITAELAAGGGPLCAVCRARITKGTPCIKIRSRNTESSQFFMHVGCSGGVLFNLMRAFNYSHNGLSKGTTDMGRSFGELTGVPTVMGFVKVTLGQGRALKMAGGPKKRGPGRPKGSKNKPKTQRVPLKRGPGRPKGSKNKPKN